MSDRAAFFARIREAVRQGNEAGPVPPLPERGGVGYQGAGADPVACLRSALEAAGAFMHEATDWANARLRVWALLQDRGCQRVLVGPGLPGLVDDLRRDGLEVYETTTPLGRPTLFAADAGVSGADWLVAETGSIALESRPDQPRALTLLPPLHVAMVPRSRVVADLFDLFAVQGVMPSCLTLITGPSKTGDIELRLVTGVHGPGEVHVVLIADS